MLAYLFRRMLGALSTLVGITALTFVLLRLTPGDPLLGSAETLSPVSPQILNELRHAQGLDRPLPVQYAEWVGRIARFDFGRSLRDQRPVREKLSEAAPRTLALTGAALFLAALFAVFAGTLAAARPGTWWDRGWMGTTSLLQALPSFWVGVMALEWFATAHGLRLFPLQGWVSDHHAELGLGGRIADVLWHGALPVLCLGYGAFALFTRHIRSGVTQVLLREEWIQTARAKGLPERIVLFRHALRPALTPLVTSLGLALPGVLSGSVIIEQVFGIPGMGLLAFDSLLARDFNTVLGVTTCVALMTLLGSVLCDLAYAWLDPRIRLASGGEKR